MNALEGKPPAWFIEALDWVPLKIYLQVYGETKEAVRKRIATEVWKVGEQYARPEGAGLWVSIKGVNAWASRHSPKA